MWLKLRHVWVSYSGDLGLMEPYGSTYGNLRAQVTNLRMLSKKLKLGIIRLKRALKPIVDSY